MAFEKPQITPRRRIEVPEEARREARAGMGGEVTRTATMPPAAAESTASALVAPAPVSAAKPTSVTAVPDALTAGHVRISTRGRKATVTVAPAPEAEVPLHTVQIAKSVVQEIKMSLLLVIPGPETPTTIKNYLEIAHRYYDAHLRKTGRLPPVK